MLDVKTLGKDWIYAGVASLEIEEIVLGTLINFPNNFYTRASELNVNFFNHHFTRVIFNTILEVTKDGKLDIIILTDKLKNKPLDVNDKFITKDYISYVNDICDRARTDIHLSDHIKILSEYAKKRMLRSISEFINEEIDNSGNIESIISNVNIKMTNVSTLNNDVEFDKVAEVTKVINAMSNPEKKDIIHSYHEDLDKFIYGWEYGNFVVIAAAASMGKTAFALELKRKSIAHNEPMVLFSLEMGKEELIRRMIAAEAYVPMNTMRRKLMTSADWARIHKATTHLLNKDWIIEDDILDLDKMINRIKYLYYKKGIKKFMIDYIQLISVRGYGKNMIREQEISLITRTLKLLAKELGILIIGLSQITRAVTKREDKRPQLSDLRESGAIEQDADMVIFVYREAYYNLGAGIPHIEDIELIIAKGRATGIGVVHTKFISSLGRFPNISEYDYINLEQRLLEDEYSERPIIYDKSVINETKETLPDSARSGDEDPELGY